MDINIAVRFKDLRVVILGDFGGVGPDKECGL